MKIIKLLSLVAFLATGLFAVNNPAYFTKANSKKSFSKQYNHLNNEEIDMFILGKSFFRIPWVEAPSATTARDGLGPLFDANACISCHPNNSLGSVYNKDGNVSRSMVIRLSIPSSNSKEHKGLLAKTGFIPEPIYGAQVSINGTEETPFEAKLAVKYTNKYVTYPDGQTVVLSKPIYSLNDKNYGEFAPHTSISIRKAPALVGLGLIEDISNEDILKNADEHDMNKDGISGRANWVYSILNDNYTLGRYTYKASAPTVRQQSAAAFHNDMGLTTTMFPNDNCTSSQTKCINSPQARDKIDVPDLRLDAITFYLTSLKVPTSKTHDKKGEELFNKVGCASCHVSSFTTTKGIKIKPYSDFLLHDMGDELSDGRIEFKATKNEWRTSPLWGINSYKKTIGKNPDFLHDGRAKSLEEAILWHGGESKKAKESFMSLNQSQREMLIKFIRSL